MKVSIKPRGGCIIVNSESNRELGEKRLYLILSLINPIRLWLVQHRGEEKVSGQGCPSPPLLPLFSECPGHSTAHSSDHTQDEPSSPYSNRNLNPSPRPTQYPFSPKMTSFIHSVNHHSPQSVLEVKLSRNWPHVPCALQHIITKLHIPGLSLKP